MTCSIHPFFFSDKKMWTMKLRCSYFLAEAAYADGFMTLFQDFGLTHPFGLSDGDEYPSDLGYTSGLFSGIGAVPTEMMLSGRYEPPPPKRWTYPYVLDIEWKIFTKEMFSTRDILSLGLRHDTLLLAFNQYFSCRLLLSSCPSVCLSVYLSVCP